MLCNPNSITIFVSMQDEVITFKASKHFKDHVKEQAKKKKLKPSAFIKAVIKKQTGYKEPNII
jgi:hypothetical protein